MNARMLLFVPILSTCLGVSGDTSSFRPVERGRPSLAASTAGFLKPCKVPGVESTAFCGSYEVFENRAVKSGRKIALNIVVVPASNPTPAPDPLFWLEGGPGAAATKDAPLVRAYFSEVHKDRDLVFVDQRGTGNSNPLNCDVGDSPDELQKFFGGTPLRESVQQCRESLEKVADLPQYTTPIAMDDLDEVREALGYAKINIGGESYGSFASLIYLRRHGDHVRAVFLAGVATPAIKQPLQFARSAQHALDLLIEDCASDNLCRTNYPRLREEFDAVLARFHDGPVRVEFIRPKDKQKESVLLYRDSFVDRLRLVLANTGTARYFPFIIHKAFEGDYLPFESGAIFTNPGQAIARGMYLSVTCSEGARFISEDDIRRETSGTFIGDHRVRQHIEACKEWPTGEISPSYIEPTKASVPVLMITGEADAASGPWFAAEAIKHFPNGKLVDIRNYGHQFGEPCTASIFSEFIEKGTTARIDTTCTDSIRRPAFATALPPRFSLQ